MTVKHYLTIEIEIEGESRFRSPTSQAIDALRQLADHMEANNTSAATATSDEGDITLWMDWSLWPTGILKQARDREAKAKAITQMFQQRTPSQTTTKETAR